MPPVKMECRQQLRFFSGGSGKEPSDPMSIISASNHGNPNVDKLGLLFCEIFENIHPSKTLQTKTFFSKK